MANEFVESDTGSILRLTCKNNTDESVIDVTGATVVLRYKIDGGTLQTKAMTLQDATNGIVQVQFGAGELTPGELTGAAQITDSGGLVLTQLEPGKWPIRALET